MALFSGAAISAPPATVLATVTVQNTSGSTQATNFIPQSFGHPFKQGDVPSGQYPQIQLTSGTPVPATIYGQEYWNDGSLAWAGFVVRVPTTVAGSGTLTLNVLNGGSAPAASSRSLSDLSAQNLQCQYVGLFNLSGTWTSFLNHGISNTNQAFAGASPDILVYADGPAGKCWRIRASAEQSGSPHGQLETYWYIWALEDASGGLYGIRFLPHASQPWYNNTSSPTPKFLGFSSVGLYNGATFLLDPTAGNLGVGSSASSTFTWDTNSGDPNYPANLLVTSIPASWTQNQCVVLTTTGTLPGGFSTNTPYFQSQLNTVTSSTTISIVEGIATGVSGTNSGTGTHTMTPIPYICTSSGEYFRTSDGKYNYIQGGGSVAAESTTRLVIDKVYWNTTRMLPPMDTSLVVTPQPSTTTWWNYTRPWPNDIGQTGDGSPGQIGVFTSWAALHYLGQDAADETQVRHQGFMSGTFTIWARNTSNKLMPTNDGSSYTGMTNAGIGWSLPVLDATAQFNCWAEADSSHMPNGSWYAYVFTAEPHLHDTIIYQANWAPSSLYGGDPTTTVGTVNSSFNDISHNASNPGNASQRGSTINGTFYSGADLGNLRLFAWGTRDLGAGHRFVASHPENSLCSNNLTTYLTGWNTRTWDAQIAFNTINTTYWNSSGIWLIRQTADTEPYQQSYCLMSMSMNYAWNQYANTLTHLNLVASWYEHTRATFGGWHCGAYDMLARPDGTDTGPIVSGDNQVGYPISTISWTPSGFTFNGGQADYAVTNGDTYLWRQDLTTPVNFTWGQQYFVVGVSGGGGSGSTFGLSATKGGSPIAPGDTQSGIGVFVTWSAAPSTTSIAGGGGTRGFLQDALGGLSFAQAVGCTGLATVIADQQTRITHYGGTDYAIDPGYNFQPSF